MIQDRHITVRLIQETVVDHYDLRLSDMYSDRRSRGVARPRQVAMFLARDLTPKSLPLIGKLFGGRDHTTVMHAIRRVEELCKIDADIHADVEDRTLEERQVLHCGAHDLLRGSRVDRISGGHVDVHDREQNC